ncbi:MAG: hypothetical protein KF764_18980 [Labilithrix sp.]|nr:hypothetical protein [Labilithrix sp.]
MSPSGVDRPRRAGSAACLAGLMLASLFAPSGDARAATPRPIAVRTVETLHDGCPTSPSLAERLTARLERIHEAAENEQAVRVEIHVERVGNLSHGTLALDVGDERAEREASSPSCEEVVAALAVMAAIGLDQGVLPPPAPAASPPTPRLRPPRSRPDERERVLDVPPAPAPARSRGSPRLSLATGIEAASNRSLIVMPMLFGEVGFRTTFAPSVRLGAGRSFQERFVTRQGTASVQWTKLLLGACADALRAGALRLRPCVEGEVGSIDAVVDAPLPFRSQSEWWGAAGASARLSWQAHSAFSFEVNGGARVPLLRYQLFFEPATAVYQTPALIPFAGAAFIAHLH